MYVYKSFEEMVCGLEFLTYEETKQLVKTWGSTSDEVYIEEHDENTASVEANNHCFEIVKNITANEGLHVVTLCIEDLDDGSSVYCYSSGFHTVSRMKYFLVKNASEGYYSEGV